MAAVSIFLLFGVSLLPGVRAEGTVLVLYEEDQQRLAYNMAAEDFNRSDVNIVYKQCEEGISILQVLSHSNLTLDQKLDHMVVVGACDEEKATPMCIPQVICSNESTTSPEHIINLQQTLPSVYPSLRDLLLSLNTSSVTLMHNGGQEVSRLVKMLTSAGLSIMLRAGLEKTAINSAQVAIATNRAEACLLSGHHITLLLLEEDDVEPVVCGYNSHIYTMNWETTYSNMQLLESINSSLRAYPTTPSLNTESFGATSCRYNSMYIAQSALNKTRGNAELLQELWREQERVLSTSPGSVVIRRNDALRSIVGSWSHRMGLNLTEPLEEMDNDGTNQTISTASYDAPLTALGVVSAFAVVGVVYSVALIAFNCSKSKDRTIKLTSPNMNIMVCFGSLLALLSLFLLGLESPIINDLTLLATFQQAGAFSQSVGLTIVYSCILMKTWRVHRIFKKMHLSSKGTKDEHLILMVLALTLLDITINACWAKVDQILCVTYLPMQSEQNPTFVCSSKYQAIWSCLLVVYKLIIIVTTLFYARHVRHVKLPSLQDSQFILTNSLISIVALLTSLPALASPKTISTTRYTTYGLATLAMVYSTLSLLLAPKILLVKNKDGTKTSSAVKFLFGESLKKHKDKDDYSKGCWGGIKSCNSQSGSSMGDSMLSQEIETLKQLVKEKDETIRELTDRLFFGADKFKAYVKDKTASYRRSCSSPAVSKFSELEGQQSYQTRTRQERYNQKLQGLSVNSKEPRNMNTSYSENSPSRANYYTVENPATCKHATHSSQLPHTLTPIKELSGCDLANHCKALADPMNAYYKDLDRSATPTTDSAINMSHSASSSEDECYQEGQCTLGGSGKARLFRLHSQSLQAKDCVKESIECLPGASKETDHKHVLAEPSSRHQQVFDVKRLAAVANRRQLTNQHPVTSRTTNKRPANVADPHHKGSSKDSLQREEVELDIVFPVSECL